jgi:hypothetical protein
MTVNLRPSGKLLRVNMEPNCISDLHPIIGKELAISMHEPAARSTYGLAGSEALRDAVLAGIGKAVSAAFGSPVLKVQLSPPEPTSEHES